MNNVKYRNYQRVYKRNKGTADDEKVFTLSIGAAAGIIAFAFLKGMFWGYVLKKRCN